MALAADPTASLQYGIESSGAPQLDDSKCDPPAVNHHSQRDGQDTNFGIQPSARPDPLSTTARQKVEDATDNVYKHHSSSSNGSLSEFFGPRTRSHLVSLDLSSDDESGHDTPRLARAVTPAPAVHPQSPQRLEQPLSTPTSRNNAPDIGCRGGAIFEGDTCQSVAKARNLRRMRSLIRFGSVKARFGWRGVLAKSLTQSASPLSRSAASIESSSTALLTAQDAASSPGSAASVCTTETEGHAPAMEELDTQIQAAKQTAERITQHRLACRWDGVSDAVERVRRDRRMLALLRAKERTARQERDELRASLNHLSSDLMVFQSFIEHLRPQLTQALSKLARSRLVRADLLIPECVLDPHIAASATIDDHLTLQEWASISGITADSEMSELSATSSAESDGDVDVTPRPSAVQQSQRRPGMDASTQTQLVGALGGLRVQTALDEHSAPPAPMSLERAIPHRTPTGGLSRSASASASPSSPSSPMCFRCGQAHGAGMHIAATPPARSRLSRATWSSGDVPCIQHPLATSTVFSLEHADERPQDPTEGSDLDDDRSDDRDDSDLLPTTDALPSTTPPPDPGTGHKHASTALLPSRTQLLHTPRAGLGRLSPLEVRQLTLRLQQSFPSRLPLPARVLRQHGGATPPSRGAMSAASSPSKPLDVDGLHVASDFLAVSVSPETTARMTRRHYHHRRSGGPTSATSSGAGSHSAVSEAAGTMSADHGPLSSLQAGSRTPCVRESMQGCVADQAARSLHRAYTRHSMRRWQSDQPTADVFGRGLGGGGPNSPGFGRLAVTTTQLSTLNPMGCHSEDALDTQPPRRAEAQALSVRSHCLSRASASSIRSKQSRGQLRMSPTPESLTYESILWRTILQGINPWLPNTLAGLKQLSDPAAAFERRAGSDAGPMTPTAGGFRAPIGRSMSSVGRINPSTPHAAIAWTSHRRRSLGTAVAPTRRSCTLTGARGTPSELAAAGVDSSAFGTLKWSKSWLVLAAQSARHAWRQETMRRRTAYAEYIEEPLFDL